MPLTPIGARVFALALVLASILALGAFVRRRRQVLRALGDPEPIGMLLGIDPRRAPLRRLAPIAAAALLLALGVLDPTLREGAGGGSGPVVLLLDLSGSMLVTDLEPNRLESQRRFARELVARAGGAPIGIVAFAGRAFTLTPPTRDGSAIEMFLATLDPTIVTQGGSALDAAIRQGVALLADRPGARGTLVLLSDGEATDDRAGALAAAELAARNGLRLLTVGIGTREGGPVPAFDPNSGESRGTLTDPAGERVMSRLDDAFLRELAQRGGGSYHPIGEARSSFPRLSAAATTGRGRIPLHLVATALALGLLVLEPLARTGRGGR